MGYLVHIVLAIGALAAVESGVATKWELPLGVLLLACLPHALALLDKRLFLRGHFRVAAFVYSALAWAPLVAFAAAIALCGWPTTVERWSGGRPTMLGWPHPRLLLSLAPFIVYTLVSLDARARVADVRATEIARARLFQARLFISGLAPFVLFLGVTWLVGIDARVRTNIENVGLWGGVFAAAMLTLSLAVLPWLLLNTWDATPMPRGATREMLESFGKSIGFRCRELLVWNTGHQMANAAVIGVSARQRVVLFSDALLLQLPPRELLAVFAHEIGHVARHHVFAFVAWALALFLGFDLVLGELAPDSELWLWAGLVVVLGLWYVGFGFLSRRAELEADLFAIEVTGDLEALARALELVGSPHSRRIGSWRHFSTERRIAFLRRAKELPALARRLRSSLRVATWLGIAVAVAVAALETRALLRDLPRDRVAVALALGEYEEARTRLAQLETADEELARRVRVANELYRGDHQPDVERLTRAALGALPRGERELAGDYLALAELRGRDGLQPAIDALEANAPNGDVFVLLNQALKTGTK